MEDKTFEGTIRPNNLLKRERNLRGWSFKDVADRIACPDVRLVRRWEHGDVFPGSEYRQKLCQLFEKNAEELGLLKEFYTKVSMEQQQKAPEHVFSEESFVARSLPMAIDKQAAKEDLPPVTRQFAQNLVRDINRQQMIDRVRYFWIQGLLEHSLYGATPIALGLHEERELVENPWQFVVQEAVTPSHVLPLGTPITQVYDSSHGELLILGEPGAGKTTLLLELAQVLLERATQDEAHPLPVVFNLSSWAVKQQSFCQWLVEELIVKYQVPRRVGQTWIEQDKLLLLLDGLDEVDVAIREECVKAINSYREAHGLVSLVICCRRSEYLNQKMRLLLHNAIMVQSLTTQQIDVYLKSGDEKLARLRELLIHDSELQELINTPLMLSILVQTSQEEHGDDLILQGTLEEKREHLFRTYVQYMLQRRTSHKVYTQEQTQVWLSWLAKQMKLHSQTVFHIESLQFNALTEGVWSRLIPTFAFGLIAASICWVTYGLYFQTQLMHGSWIQSGLVGLLAFFCYVIMNGFIRAKVTWFDAYLSDRQGCSNLLKRMSCLTAYGLCQSLPVGLCVGLLMGRISGFTYGAAHSLYNIIILTTSTMLLGILPRTIQPIEILFFSWKNLRKRLIYCIGSGVVTALAFWVFFLHEFGLVHAGLLGLLIGSVSSCLFAGNVGLVSSKKMDTQYRLLPNEGIHRSIKNSLTIGVVSACMQGMLSGLVFSFVGLNMAFVVYGIIPAISAFHVMIVRTGGYAWIQHYLLRFCLWRTAVAPWNYPMFLDYAVERILLRRVGGGYIFIHRSLLDYFANIDIATSLEVRKFKKVK